jgi:hypothetical protein
LSFNAAKLSTFRTTFYDPLGFAYYLSVAFSNFSTNFPANTFSYVAAKFFPHIPTNHSTIFYTDAVTNKSSIFWTF